MKLRFQTRRKVTPLLQEQRHGSIGNVVRPQAEQAVSERRKLHRTPENRHYDIGFNRKQIIFQADVLEESLHQRIFLL